MMKRLLYILFLCFCIIHAQDYKITFFGLPAVDVNMDMDLNIQDIVLLVNIILYN